ncbi:phage virion morphogenesis protein [Bradyrhizobium sp. th.b2]|uniref:phage virion morphogenesis protein n=1 Tax=Bradyrhizobium sp. th-b2 TaxID=172088 RepID=UPI0004066DEA|nr:phage virion morphogenesis protein [Bradyrhizobium sp. th.b2]
MADLQVRVDASDLRKLNKRISELLHDTLNLQPVYASAAEYMKNSTVNRVLRSKTGPDGERWAALREVTVKLKGGNDSILFDSGELAKWIQVEDVTHDGFVLSSTALNHEGEPYSSYVQDGVKRTKGMIRRKKIPPRPFMGFSDENKRRISKMIRDYLAHGGD